MEILNFRLLSHPLNWIIVWAILAVLLVGYGAIHDAVTTNNITPMTGTGS